MLPPLATTGPLVLDTDLETDGRLKVSFDVVDGGVGGMVMSEKVVILDPVLSVSACPIGPVGGVTGGEVPSLDCPIIVISASS